MKKTVLSFAGLGLVVPMLLGATDAQHAIPGAETLLWWQWALIALAGSVGTGTVGALIVAARKGIGAYFIARGTRLLNDKDKSNDAAGEGWIAAGKAFQDTEKKGEEK